MANTEFINQIEEEDSIDILDLIKYLWSKVLVLILAAIIGSGAAFAYTKFMITPQYAASSMIYVYGKSTTVSTLVDLQVGSQLTADFVTIAKTREVINAATASVGLDAPYEIVASKVAVTAPDNSRILKITVTDPNPELACKLSNAMADQLRARIAEVMATDEPSVVEVAIVPTTPVSPSTMKNTAIGGMALFVIVAAIYVVKYLLDDTIKTADDVEKYLKLNVIAYVPMVTKDGKHKKSHKKTAVAKA